MNHREAQEMGEKLLEGEPAEHSSLLSIVCFYVRDRLTSSTFVFRCEERHLTILPIGDLNRMIQNLEGL